MTATLYSQETFRVTVTAASPAASLAILFIAGKLGIEPSRAAEQLASLPAVLSEALPDHEARRMATMLSLLGLQVRLDPASSFGPPTQDFADVALHLAEGADRAGVVARLAEVLGRGIDGAVPDAGLGAGLDRAGGLVLPDLAAEERDRISRALKRETGLRITCSDPATAVYDLFVPRSPRLSGVVTRLGLSPCRFSGGAAGGINRATGTVLLGLAGPGAVLIDRAFQRFDLRLQAAPGLAHADVAAFLETRAGVNRGPLRGAGADPQPRLDADLSRRAAERFVADYAAIGLEVTARLRGALPESR